MKLSRDNETTSTGECVEKSDIREEVVFKKIWQYSDANRIDITEYKINQPHLSPEHSSKILFTVRYKFSTNIESDLEQVEVNLNA